MFALASTRLRHRASARTHERIKTRVWLHRLWTAMIGAILLVPSPSVSQLLDAAAIIARVNAANQARVDNVLGFTDVEYYKVFRGKDDKTPAAEMSVRVTYRKGVGKDYQILSQSGSPIIRKFGLESLLENEKDLNDPAKVQFSWFTSTNYEMQLKPGETQQIDGRTCIALDITTRHKAPNMIDGTLWVDPRDGTIAEVDGIASKSPNVFAGTTHMTRLYTNINGYAMAAHARAESNSMFFGRTLVTIDYTDYSLQMRAEN